MEQIICFITGTAFSEYSERFGYIGIFLFFVTVDQLTPIPEEITLLTIGYLASNHVFNPFIAGFISVTAFLTVDIIYFFLAKSGNKFIKKIIESKKNSLIDKYKERLKTHFGLTLLVLCFIPRMRLFSPIFAGIMNLSFKKFILFDTIGLVIFTTVYISLGMMFHTSLQAQLAKLEILQHVIFAAVMLFFAVVIVLFIKKMQR